MTYLEIWDRDNIARVMTCLTETGALVYLLIHALSAIAIQLSRHWIESMDD